MKRKRRAYQLPKEKNLEYNPSNALHEGHDWHMLLLQVRVPSELADQKIG